MSKKEISDVINESRWQKSVDLTKDWKREHEIKKIINK